MVGREEKREKGLDRCLEDLICIEEDLEKELKSKKRGK